MDKNVASVLGVVGSLAAAAASAQATEPGSALRSAMQATSYADLITPIPNALAMMKAEEANSEKERFSSADPMVQEAQFVEPSPYYRYPYYYQYDPRIRRYRRYLRYNYHHRYHHHHFYRQNHHHHSFHHHHHHHHR